MLLSVIIVNYNVKYFLEYCLHAVNKAMKNIEGEIFVVDNQSTDKSRDFFCNKFQKVNFIWNTENEGFAKANNKALKQASGDYILFLNPDTILAEDSLEKCVAFIKSHNDQIACGIKMIDGTGKFLKESKRAFPSPVTSLYKLFGLSGIFPKSKIFSKYHLGYLDENINHEVDVLAGAFMMMPRKIIQDVGNFDESFFMYGEDIDLSYRIQKAGYKNFYFAESSIIHFKGESTKKGSLNYVKFFYSAMIVFVKKHYGGAQAGVFRMLIQLAIFLRAGLAATARFLKWIGLPVIDAAIILASFWLVKSLWSRYVMQQVNYSPNMLLIAFPAFTLLFLLASYFAGLYDFVYRQSRLIKSTITAILVLLAAYSLLPETLRFSRGILLLGSIVSFFFMALIRWLLLRWKIIDSADEADEINQTIVAGSESNFAEVNAVLQQAGMYERVLGRINPGLSNEANTIGSFEKLGQVLKLYPVKEIIFCEGLLSFKKIIEAMQQLPRQMRIKIFVTGTHTLIGSVSKNEAGNFVSTDAGFRLAHAITRRNKTLADVIIAFFFLITFPLHFIIKRKPFLFFRNVFSVLFLKKTWVGYALGEKDLPVLKPGILTTTGLPAILNTLPTENLHTTDVLYAQGFYILKDIKIVWVNYKLLSF
ncbi:MAG: glycosyltransferase [Ginsengibacter sp.]